MVEPGVRKCSIEETKATSRSPEASPSASRLGTSTTIFTCGASRPRQCQSGLALR